MLQGENGLLPSDDTGFFLAGDIRANENPELASLQTLFVREHNRVAARIAEKNPAWTDEELYQAARNFVIGDRPAAHARSRGHRAEIVQGYGETNPR